MQKNESSVGFSQKTNKSITKVPVNITNKQKSMKDKVRSEISQAFN